MFKYFFKIFFVIMLSQVLFCSEVRTINSIESLSPMSFINPKTYKIDPLKKWYDGISYKGGSILKVAATILKVRRPQTEELKKLNDLKKELGIKIGVMIRIIDTENDYEAFRNELSVGAIEIMTEDYDTSKYIFIRDDIISADKAVLRDALNICNTFLISRDNYKIISIEHLSEFLKKIKKLEDYKITSVDEFENAPLKDIIAKELLKWHNTKDLNAINAFNVVHSKERIKKFCDTFKLIYNEENFESYHFSYLSALLDNLKQKDEVEASSSIRHISEELKEKFKDFLPIRDVFYGTEKYPIDMFFMPNGEAVILKGLSRSGKGSLMKALHDVGMEEGYFVGSEDFTCLFSAGGNLFAASHMFSFNNIERSKEDDKLSFKAKIRAGAFGKREDNNVFVRWRFGAGKVAAIIELNNQGLNIDFPANGYSITKDVVSSLNRLSTPEYILSSENISPIPRFKIDHFIVQHRKYYELAELIKDKIILSMTATKYESLKNRKNILSHRNWLLELMLDDGRFNSLSESDKKFLTLIDTETEFIEERYQGEKGEVKIFSKMKYMGNVKILPYGEIQFQFKDVNSGEEHWLYSWVVIDLIKNLNVSRFEIEEAKDERFPSRVSDKNISFSNSKSSLPYQEDRYVIKDISIDVIPNGNGKLLAVMDGHNGIRTVQLVEKLLAKLFEEAMIISQGNIDLAFKNLFQKLNEYTKNEKSGCTCSIVYLPYDSSFAHYAVLGDSPIMIKGRDGRLFIAPNHNAAQNLKERERVQSMGAFYEDGYVKIGIKGNIVGIQISGALGDSEFDFLLTREPFIGSIPISFRSFIILGSDGLFNSKKSHIADDIKHIIELVKQGHNAEDVVNDALMRQTEDNVTAIVASSEALKKNIFDTKEITDSYILRWNNWKPSNNISHPRHITNDKNLLLGAVIAGVIPAIVIDIADNDSIQKNLIEIAKKKNLYVIKAPEYSIDSDYIVGIKENVESLYNLLKLKFDGKIFIDDFFRSEIGRLQGFNENEIKRYLNVIKSFSKLDNEFLSMGFTFAGLFNPYTDSDFRFLYSGWVNGNNLVAIDGDDLLIGHLNLPWKKGDFQKISWYELEYKFPKKILRDKSFVFNKQISLEKVETSS